MPNLSWNEVRDRAIKFSREWAGTTSESAEKQTFWNEFFETFGLRRRTVASFEEPVKNIKGRYGFIDLFWRGMLLVEHKSAGKDLDKANSQAFEYIQSLAREGRLDEIPRYVIVSDFRRFALHDLEPEDQRDLPLFDHWRVRTVEFTLAELPRYIREFAFLKGEKPIRLDPEDPANEKAYSIMVNLHDALDRGGFPGHELERLLVRVLFCLFADDTGIWEPCAFQHFVETRTSEDGSDLGAHLNRLFEVLNTPEGSRQETLDEDLAAFPYVNGALFAERLGFAEFNRNMRNALLACCRFQWARISPAVFGSLFQGIINVKERRQRGAHYTTERDIMKVINSLFLDDLRAEFNALTTDRSTRRRSRLEEFHDKLRELRFFDPACGCGNFLVLTYRELRRLELDLLRELYGGQQFTEVGSAVKVDVDQFYGIEINEWPVRIAEVALWLMDHQMNVEVAEAFGQNFRRLPLRSTPDIKQGNALRLRWQSVLSPEKCSFVLGNPPFVGKKEQNAEQKTDMELVWPGVAGAGVLDYVTCWYRRASEYIADRPTKVAFVSTNSISQGEQVGILWAELFRQQIKIHFAHRTFPWTSEARGAAHVHVVIIGFGLENPPRKRLYEYDSNDGHVTVNEVPNISPYLIAAGDTLVRSRSQPLMDAPPISYGSMMIDKGRSDGDDAGLILTQEHKDALLAECPRLQPFIRQLLGGEEFLNGGTRWCLWLVDAPPNLLRESPLLRARIEKVRRFREASGRAQTRELAATPMLFGENRQPGIRYLLIPKVSSMSRRYLPIGFVDPNIIASGSTLVIPGAELFHFGVLSSAMHNVWMRTVAGRMKSDFQYSSAIVYNNYPWPPDIDARRRRVVEAAAQGVLDERMPLLPPNGGSTLAELYDPLGMPAPLTRAHAELDRAVDRCYRSEPFHSDRERLEYLFALYERMTAPVLPATPRKRGIRSQNA